MQRKIINEYSVFMVFGIYAVNNDREDVKAIRSDIAAFVKKQEHIKSFHAVYLEPETEKIYCDLIADYDLKDWGALEKEFTEYMKKRYPHNEIALTVETEYV